MWGGGRCVSGCLRPTHQSNIAGGRTLPGWWLSDARAPAHLPPECRSWVHKRLILWGRVRGSEERRVTCYRAALCGRQSVRQPCTLRGDSKRQLARLQASRQLGLRRRPAHQAEQTIATQQPAGSKGGPTPIPGGEITNVGGWTGGQHTFRAQAYRPPPPPPAVTPLALSVPRRTHLPAPTTT